MARIVKKTQRPATRPGKKPPPRRGAAVAPSRPEQIATAGTRELEPPFRRLRGYAFDPSMSQRLDTAGINEVSFKVRWEGRAQGFGPGPVGEYVEVVDVDPASGQFYHPVDLDDPVLLAQDGYAPSEGNPQFHQQFVYAVAMTTIETFERALGRRALWSPRFERRGGGVRSVHVRRLRIYPHALREANAYYSPDKKALLFGYFPSLVEPGSGLPGGMTFTCLSHDVIAHETSHALLDGMHRRYMEDTHPDLGAFHEAFADIVALFQHFSFPEVLRHQIARVRGDLDDENMLAQLAQEFGRAAGGRGALRDALGETDPETGRWHRTRPDPTRYLAEEEPHDRGSILVAAVFDAFVAIYRARVADLLRIATGGTGELPAGAIHPDLAARLAGEAAKTARHVLTMCIRALDYCPPVDLTFGEYLRALVTADVDLCPDDDRGYRVAFVESFRRWGLYPRYVRSLSVESLRWQLGRERKMPPELIRTLSQSLLGFADLLDSEATSRAQTYDLQRWLCATIHGAIRALPDLEPFEDLTGLVLRPDTGPPDMEKRRDPERPADRRRWPVFEVHAAYPARRVGPDGQMRSDLVIVLTQRRRVPEVAGRNAPKFAFRGGCTLILDLDSLELRYGIRKRILSEDRLARTRDYLAQGDTSLRALYLGAGAGLRGHEPFALLHRRR